MRYTGSRRIPDIFRAVCSAPVVVLQLMTFDRMSGKRTPAGHTIHTHEYPYILKVKQAVLCTKITANLG